MGYRAYVAKKYDVRYDAAFFMSEFETFICQLKGKPGYEGIIRWNNENYDAYELSKSLLEKAKYDTSLSDELRGFAGEILASCDPDLDYVRIDCF